jgi:hypothetical protein
MADKIPIPPHVLKPGPTTKFVVATKQPATKTAGLGYSILRALGAHERLGPVCLDVVAKWSAEYAAAHGGVTPDTMNLAGQAFEDRVGPAWGAHRAADNAACYPGGNAGRRGYAVIYREVWVEQRWPELCMALAGSAPPT